MIEFKEWYELEIKIVINSYSPAKDSTSIYDPPEKEEIEFDAYAVFPTRVFENSNFATKKVEILLPDNLIKEMNVRDEALKHYKEEAESSRVELALQNAEDQRIA